MCRQSARHCHIASPQPARLPATGHPRSESQKATNRSSSQPPRFREPQRLPILSHRGQHDVLVLHSLRPISTPFKPPGSYLSRTPGRDHTASPLRKPPVDRPGPSSRPSREARILRSSPRGVAPRCLGGTEASGGAEHSLASAARLWRPKSVTFARKK